MITRTCITLALALALAGCHTTFMGERELAVQPRFEECLQKPLSEALRQAGISKRQWCEYERWKTG